VVGQEVSVTFNWPQGAQLARLSVAVQTDLFGPWHELPIAITSVPSGSISLGAFSEATPVSYRVRVGLRDGQNTEIRGYFQVHDPTRRLFWYDYQFDQQSKRIWSHMPNGHWCEAYPDGHMTMFREVTNATIEGISGVVARRLPPDGFEVWIPDEGPGERWLRFRAGETNGWSGLGAIHEVNLGLPPPLGRDTSRSE
jgi:hypothetical protein